MVTPKSFVHLPTPRSCEQDLIWKASHSSWDHPGVRVAPEPVRESF